MTGFPAPFKSMNTYGAVEQAAMHPEYGDKNGCASPGFQACWGAGIATTEVRRIPMGRRIGMVKCISKTNMRNFFKVA